MRTTTALLAIGVVAAALPARAQDYPARPITVISAQASGGASDTVVRAVQEPLQAALGQPLVMENRPGASGNVGAQQVARAAPDGYTLMIGTDAMMTSNVHLFKSMPFDPVKDFAPITNAGANIIVLAVNEQYVAAIGLAAWTSLAVTTVDNLLRPLLVGRDTKMPDLLVLVSTFGGLASFGAVGLVIGPVIAGLFITIWSVLEEYLQAGGFADKPAIADLAEAPPDPPEKSTVPAEIHALRAELEELKRQKPERPL